MQPHLASLLTSRLWTTGILAPAESCTADHIAHQIPDFHHDSDASVLYESRYKQHDNIKLVHDKDKKKVRLLLSKFSSAELVRYITYIVMVKPRTISFNDTIQMLKKSCGQKSSLFNARFKCLQIVKKRSWRFSCLGRFCQQRMPKILLEVLDKASCATLYSLVIYNHQG